MTHAHSRPRLVLEWALLIVNTGDLMYAVG